jgi:hypothetical protein
MVSDRSYFRRWVDTETIAKMTYPLSLTVMFFNGNIYYPRTAYAHEGQVGDFDVNSKSSGPRWTPPKDT